MVSDMWHVVNILSIFQLSMPSFNCLACIECWEDKDQSVKYLFTDKAVCRTAPATPGLSPRPIQFINCAVCLFVWMSPTPPPYKPFIYKARKSSLVPEGFLTAQLLQKL